MTFTVPEDEEESPSAKDIRYQCYGCQKFCMREDPTLIRAVGRIYHKQCFCCNNCQKSVLEKFYIMSTNTRKDVILCQDDYYIASKYKCHQCNQLIQNDNYEMMGIYKYHRECMYCPGCTIEKRTSSVHSQQNDSSSLDKKYDYNGRPYCRYHFSLIKGIECCGCGQAIISKDMGPEKYDTSKDGKWHPECFMIQKYWQVELKCLDIAHSADYNSKEQLLWAQDYVESIRKSVIKEAGQFEERVSKFMSDIVFFSEPENHDKEFEACQALLKQYKTLFTVLDLLFAQQKYNNHLPNKQQQQQQQQHGDDVSYNVPTQKLSDQLVSFLDILANKVATTDYLMKMTASICYYTRDLVKLSLQQAARLEQNFGQENSLIDQVLQIFSNQYYKKTMDISYLEHSLQLIDIAVARLGSALNVIKPHHLNPVDDDETQNINEPTNNNLVRPAFFPVSHPNRMASSTSNIHQIASASNSFAPLPQRSRSTFRKQPNTVVDTSTILEETTTAMKNSPSKIDYIRRALTTTARTKRKDLSRSGTFREYKTYSLQVSPLHISLPDSHQIHTTPPLSPPSLGQKNWTIPLLLPELNLQQDCIIRHIAILYIESYITDAQQDSENLFSIDDLSNLLVPLSLNNGSGNTSRKTPNSLWGKLKTHILNNTNETSSPASLSPMSTVSSSRPSSPISNNGEKKFGVSLSNISNGSLNNNNNAGSCQHESQQFEQWKTACPSIISCFSSLSIAPSFIKDCILAMVDLDVNTEGVFRKNGNIRGLKEMCEYIDQNNTSTYYDYFKQYPMIQLAAFIKRFLRELPEPLLTFKLYNLFIQSNKQQTQAKKLTFTHYAICILPKPNRDILLLVLGFLNWVARHSDENKMNYENLARVISPNILYPEASNQQNKGSVMDNVSLCHGEINVISTMIEHFETFVKVPDDFTMLLEHPKMTEFLHTHSSDLTCSKDFTKTFNQLLRVKKDITSSTNKPVALPPSPSISSTY